MFRPRTRAKDTSDQRRHSSLAIGRVRPVALDLAEVTNPSQHRLSPNWSPHLQHNRASLGKRRTIFQAPSLDEQAEGNAPSKRTVQIALFTVGFILPLGNSDLFPEYGCGQLIASISMVCSCLSTAASKAGDC